MQYRDARHIFALQVCVALADLPSKPVTDSGIRFQANSNSALADLRRTNPGVLYRMAIYTVREMLAWGNMVRVLFR